jgi:hypothetical protein
MDSPFLWDPVERVPHLRTVPDPTPETLISGLEYRTRDRVQKVNNIKCKTPGSETFRIDLVKQCFLNPTGPVAIVLRHLTL